MMNARKTTLHRQQPCPKCGFLINAATPADLENAPPEEGDFSICVNCTSVLCFDKDLQLYLSSLEEAESVQEGLSVQLKEAILFIKRTKAAKKKHFN